LLLELVCPYLLAWLPENDIISIDHTIGKNRYRWRHNTFSCYSIFIFMVILTDKRDLCLSLPLSSCVIRNKGMGSMRITCKSKQDGKCYCQYFYPHITPHVFKDFLHNNLLMPIILFN